jgi:hypothetical protein
LAAREPLRITILPLLYAIGPSRWRESNSQPTAYKAVALPLSYIGAGDKSSYLFWLNSQVKNIIPLASALDDKYGQYFIESDDRCFEAIAVAQSRIVRLPPPPIRSMM